MSHPDEGTWNALLDGEIPSGELGPLTTHLAGCAECRARLEEARAVMGEADRLVAALGEPSSPPLAPPIKRPRENRTVVFRQLAWAASVMLAATLGYRAKDSGIPASPGQVVAPPPAEAAPAAPAAPTTARVDSSAGELRSERGTTRQAAAPLPEAPAATGTGNLARSPIADAEAATRRLEDRAREVAKSILAVPPAPQALGAAAPPTDARARRMQDQRALAAAPAPALGLAERADAASEVFTPIDFPEAVARLGGSLRMVDGLVPDRLEASAVTVRVIYPLHAGELILEQRRVGDSIRVSLRGPLSADSLAVLLGRVR